jgi:BASS family bile acid:Na+ symporter
MASSARNLIYTALIVLVVILAMTFPQPFREIGGFQLKTLIIPLLQIIMLGMGTTMSLADFGEVAKQPRAVLIGLVCQFTIMPFVGYFLSSTFKFPPEIAAGVILIGCSPSGLASNVMCFIARANVALSITITSIATLLAPIMTPALMKLLAGQFIAVSFWDMMIDILKIVILPVVVGLLLNRIFRKSAILLNRVMPLLSMTVGWTLALCVLLHNLSGFVLGYSFARLLRMPEQSCRTVAIEVGLQNGGLASGLALQMGKVATVGLAPALFGPIMNTTGSLLATFWSQRPPKEEAIVPVSLASRE